MDELTLKGEETGLILWIIGLMIKKKIGHDVDVQGLNVSAVTSREKVIVLLKANVGLNKNDIGRMKMKLGEMGSKIASCKLGRLIAEKLILRYVNCCVDFEHLEFGVEEAKGKFIVNIDAHVKLNENDLRNLIVQNIYRN